jgi:hypothetical protein
MLKNLATTDFVLLIMSACTNLDPEIAGMLRTVAVVFAVTVAGRVSQYRRARGW